MNQRTLPLLLLLPVLATSGCGGGSDDDGARDDDGAKATTTQAPAATPDPGRGVTTVDYAGGSIQLDDWRVRVDSLRREGSFMTLNATVKCVKPAPEEESCASQSAFGGRFGDNNVFAGVTIVDDSGQRAYTTVRDSDSSNSKAYAAALEPEMAPSAPARHVWARYAAPPADVRAVDLVLPEGGPLVTGVPITEGGGVDADPPAAGEQAATPAEFDRPPDSTDAAGLALGDYDVVARKTSKRRTTQDERGRRTVTLAADVLFPFDKATLGAGSRRELDQVAADVQDSSTGPVAIDGYTDAKGSDAYNLALSRRRATAVRAVLAGTLGDRELRAAGRGEADPVAPNTRGGSDNPAGRRKNRRVTVGYTLKRRPVAAEPSTSSPGAEATDQQPQGWDYVGVADDAVRFEVVPVGVRRVGNLSVLDLDVTCAQSDTSEDCEQATALTKEGSEEADAGAVTLVDPAQDATYAGAVFRDGVATLGTGVRFAPGAKRRLSLFFAAVPASTSAVTVQLPHGGPRFDGVPVS